MGVSKTDLKEALAGAFTKKQILEELIYGSVAGLFICVGGHPFE